MDHPQATIRADLSKGAATCALVDPPGCPAAALPLEATSDISTSVTLTPAQGMWTFVSLRRRQLARNSPPGIAVQDKTERNRDQTP